MHKVNELLNVRCCGCVTSSEV